MKSIEEAGAGSLWDDHHRSLSRSIGSPDLRLAESQPTLEECERRCAPQQLSIREQALSARRRSVRNPYVGRLPRIRREKEQQALAQGNRGRFRDERRWQAGELLSACSRPVGAPQTGAL